MTEKQREKMAKTLEIYIRLEKTILGDQWEYWDTTKDDWESSVIKMARGFATL